MIKKATLSYMLAVTIVQGVVPAVPAFASAPAPRTATAAANQIASPVVAPAVLPAPATSGAVRLSRNEMGQVQGGIFNWIRRLWAAVTIIVRIWGLVKQLINLFRDKGTQSAPSSVEGGERVERSENEYQDYASDADYNAGNVQSVTNEVTSDYQQTEVWYGGGGGDCGGNQDNELYMEERMITTC